VKLDSGGDKMGGLIEKRMEENSFLRERKLEALETRAYESKVGRSSHERLSPRFYGFWRELKRKLDPSG